MKKIGYKRPLAWRRKQSESRKKFYALHPEVIEEKKKIIGNKNPSWRGDEVKYSGLHAWIRKHKPKPEFCELCQKNPPKVVANKSGEYKRDILDWLWACNPCHKKFDGATVGWKNHPRNVFVPNRVATAS